MSRTNPLPDAPPSPLCRIVDLADLSQAGLEFTLEAAPEERERIAAWAGVNAVRTFTAAVALSKLSQTRFLLKVEWTAEIEQSCVVTLEPVESTLRQAIRRELIHQPRRIEDGGELTLAAGDDETPDAIEDMHYDVAAPLLEDFSLALDPYPRKAGVHFEPPAEASRVSDSPFAVLNALKEKE